MFHQSTQPDRSILAVGSMAFDSIQSPAGKAEMILGGSANYFSIAASFFTTLKLVGVVGEDFPAEHLKMLRSRGVDTTAVEIAKGKTFHWVGSYNQDLNEAQTLSTCLNVFEHFNPVLPSTHRRPGYLFLANIDPILQQSVHSQVQKPKLIAADSMNFWIAGKKSELIKTLELVDLLTINEGEAYLLSGKNNLVEAAEVIQAMGPRALVVKRGEYGALLFTGDSVFSAPALPLKTVKDPTGAGDTFAGGMMGYLAHHGFEGDPREQEDVLRKAVIYGCVMASFTVEDFGFSHLLKVTPKAIEDRFEAFMRMTRF